MHQGELAEVCPPEEQPQAIVRNHRDNLRYESGAILHRSLKIGNEIRANETQRPDTILDYGHLALASIDIHASNRYPVHSQ